MTRDELIQAVQEKGRVHFKNGDMRPLRWPELRLVLDAIRDAWPDDVE